MDQQQGGEEGAAMLALSLAGMAVGQDVLQEPAWRAEVSVFYSLIHYVRRPIFGTLFESVRRPIFVNPRQCQKLPLLSWPRSVCVFFLFP